MPRSRVITPSLSRDRKCLQPFRTLPSHLNCRSFYQATQKSDGSSTSSPTMPTHALSGNFDCPFWTSLVLRASHYEPAVMHALVSFGSLYEGCCRKEMFHTPNSADQPCFQYALRQYNTAITLLHARLSENSSGSAGAALLSCIIFGSFELLQGNGNVALLHLESGLGILQGVANGTSGDAPRSKEDVIQASEMEDVIVPLFARLDLQASSYVSQRPTQLQIPSRKPRVFSNTEQARHELTPILSTVYRFLATEAQPHKYCRAAGIPAEVKEQRSRLIADLDQWREPFDVLLSNASVSLTYSKLVGAIILKIQHRTAAILLEVCLSAAEESYDALESSFLEIVLLCETITLSPSSNTGRPSCFSTTPSSSSYSPPPRRNHPAFAIEMGIIHPLYLTAQKCRNPHIRRRAVGLLSSTGREGIWDGPFRARIAQRLIELEESGARAMPGGKMPESARIHRTDIRTDRSTGRRWMHVVWAKDAGFCEWVVVKELLSSFLGADGDADARSRRLSAESESLVVTENGPLWMREWR